MYILKVCLKEVWSYMCVDAMEAGRGSVKSPGAGIVNKVTSSGTAVSAHNQWTFYSALFRFL